MSGLILEIIDADVFIPGSAERTLVLKNMNLRLAEGEHSVILGPNGSGKSSLLKLARGDLWPCRGVARWYDARGNMEDSRVAARRLTAIVSPEKQENLLRSPWPLTVGSLLEQAAALRQNKAGANQGAALKAAALLEDLGFMDEPDLPAPSLSQGRLRLLMLLSALLAGPRLLLLDECADNLDAKCRGLALDLLDSVKDDVTMLLTTHRPDRLPGWAAGRIYLDGGRSARNIPASAAPEAAPAVEAPPPRAPLFALSNASVYINRRKVLENINWLALQGEHWRVSGGNGSGKSTFLRLLAGDEFAASGGEIRRRDPADGGWMSSLAEIRARIMLVSDLSQAQNEYPLTALELLCAGYDNTTGLHREASPEEKAGALAALKEFFPEADCVKLAQTDIRRLSTGQVRRLYLARAMLARPCALLLDEPLNGLDAQSRARFIWSLRKLAHGEGASSASRVRPSIIMVSHYEEDTPDFIKRHAMLEGGRLRVLA